MEQNPYFDPQPNVPMTLELVKNFKNALNKKGHPYWGWEVKDELGATLSWFINDEGTHAEIEALKKKGQQAIVTLRFANKKPFYEVKSAFFDRRGDVVKEEPGLDTAEGLEAYRKKVKNALYMAYKDVDTVAMEFAKEWGDAQAAERLFTPDVRQKLATSILIDYLKKS